MARIQSLLGQGQTVKQVLVTYINGTPVGQFRRGLLRRLQTSVEVKYDALLTGKGVSDLNLNQINDSVVCFWEALMFGSDISLSNITCVSRFT